MVTYAQIADLHLVYIAKNSAPVEIVVFAVAYPPSHPCFECFFCLSRVFHHRISFTDLDEGRVSESDKIVCWNLLSETLIWFHTHSRIRFPFLTFDFLFLLEFLLAWLRWRWSLLMFFGLEILYDLYRRRWLLFFHFMFLTSLSLTLFSRFRLLLWFFLLFGFVFVFFELMSLRFKGPDISYGHLFDLIWTIINIKSIHCYWMDHMQSHVVM